ncbi:F-box/WD repeat-containing protein [Salix suchowensis]|nr:F-box/WD repeat-containing protein [Salix suchowensis]
MLQLLFTVAFSAVPLTLYIPPVRSLNLFVETMEDLLRDSRVYTTRLYPRARHVWSRVLDILLCNSRLD